MCGFSCLSSKDVDDVFVCVCEREEAREREVSPTWGTTNGTPYFLYCIYLQTSHCVTLLSKMCGILYNGKPVNDISVGFVMMLFVREMVAV